MPRLHKKETLDLIDGISSRLQPLAASIGYFYDVIRVDGKLNDDGVVEIINSINDMIEAHGGALGYTKTDEGPFQFFVKSALLLKSLMGLREAIEKLEDSDLFPPIEK